MFLTLGGANVPPDRLEGLGHVRHLVAAEPGHVRLGRDGRGGQPHLGDQDRLGHLRGQLLQVALVGGSGGRAGRRGAHAVGVRVDVQADQVAHVGQEDVVRAHFQVRPVRHRAHVGPTGVTVEVPPAVGAQFVVHGPVHQLGHGHLGGGAAGETQVLAGEIVAARVTGVGRGDVRGLQLVADGEQHQPVGPADLVSMVDDLLDVLEGPLLVGRVEEIGLVRPDKGVLAVDQVGLVQGGEEVGRHEPREHVDEGGAEVLHELDLPRVAVVVGRRHAVHRRFPGQERRVAHAAEKERLVGLLQVDQGAAANYEPGRLGRVGVDGRGLDRRGCGRVRAGGKGQGQEQGQGETLGFHRFTGVRVGADRLPGGTALPRSPDGVRPSYASGAHGERQSARLGGFFVALTPVPKPLTFPGVTRTLSSRP